MLGKCLVLLEKWLVLLKKCSVLLENFFKTYARDRLVIARNFHMLEMLDHFPLEIARIENSKSKIVLEIARIENFNARNDRDRCFCRSVSTLIKASLSLGDTGFMQTQNWTKIFNNLATLHPILHTFVKWRKISFSGNWSVFKILAKGCKVCKNWQ